MNLNNLPFHLLTNIQCVGVQGKQLHQHETECINTLVGFCAANMLYYANEERRLAPMKIY